jgi:hypothetical protein
MSAEIIQFIPRARSRSDEAPAVFRSRALADDLAMDRADTAPCEYVPPYVRRGEDEPA